MRRTLPLMALLGSLGLALGASAADKPTINRRTGLCEPPPSDLRKAVERGDRAEIAREATRLGPSRLARLLSDPDRKTVLAALEAAPLLESGVLVLDAIRPLMASSDDAIRAHAVAATAALFAESDAGRLAEYDVAPETLAASCRVLAGATVNEAEPLGTRLTAIQALLDGGRACVGQLKLDNLLAAHEPEIRRAAVLAAPEGDARTQAALLGASKDSDRRVAGAAAVRLCKSKRASLPPLHDLVLAETALVEDVVELLPCLGTSTDPLDQKALATLGESGRPAVREAIKRLRVNHPQPPIAENPVKKP